MRGARHHAYTSLALVCLHLCPVYPVAAFPCAGDAQPAYLTLPAQTTCDYFIPPVQALSCYWFTVLVRLAGLLRYKPGVKAGRQYEFRIPVSEYLASHEGRLRSRKHKADEMELPQ